MSLAPRSRLLRAGALLAAAGAAGLAWSALVEPRSFRIRRHTLSLLPAGSRPLTILHLSDLHLAKGQGFRAEFVRSLVSLEPDLVVNTGDNFGGDTLPEVLHALDPLLDLPGAFVLGSNDFWGPKPKNPARYIWRRTTQHEDKSGHAELPTRELVAAFEARGWKRLDNRNASLEVGGVRLDLSGLGDAHMDAARITETHPSFGAEEHSGGGAVRIGVTHAPYSRALEAFAAAGAQLVLAGHTHGGQVRIPFWGAPVTNSDLDRTRARGLFPYRRTRVNVSAGLGYSPYAPVRFSCPPEVSLLRLVPAER
ncbi:metallophosphoesterase [Brevibacterium album]|uniref:metallophosphoesterase n=1 Tax=Brevibacterium album TaxID=417948 RepID=UPI0004097650|nr:metallophosphoesterase [Brevibacterium album]